MKIYKHTSGTGDILQYPAPALRRIAVPVDVIDRSIASLGRQMIATLQYHSLVGFLSKAFMSRGLAAPQMGVSRRLIVCGLYGEIRVLVNPEIVESNGDFSGYENCLSLPDHGRRIIMRPAHIKVKYRGLDNRQDVLEAAKDYAALLAHEIDHLNGVLYIDHLQKPTAQSQSQRLYSDNLLKRYLQRPWSTTRHESVGGSPGNKNCWIPTFEAVSHLSELQIFHF